MRTAKLGRIFVKKSIILARLLSVISFTFGASGCMRNYLAPSYCVSVHTSIGGSVKNESKYITSIIDNFADRYHLRSTGEYPGAREYFDKDIKFHIVVMYTGDGEVTIPVLTKDNDRKDMILLFDKFINENIGQKWRTSACRGVG